MADPETLTSAQLAESLHILLQQAMQTLSPEWVAGVVQEELTRLRLAQTAAVAEEWPAEWSALLHESFAPQIEAIARRLVQSEVKKALPIIADQMIRAELAQL
ncbi:MAG: hypothetical protein HQM06_06745 [Magnetococcales bacterium]|nr:hypothetical protein [Magnetococcales bacterium]